MSIYWDRPCYKCRSHTCDMSCPEQQPVSMEPVAWMLENGFAFETEPAEYHALSEWDALYTATQLAAARQQGEEEIKEAAYNKLMNSLEEQHKRIAELERTNAQLLEALKEAVEDIEAWAGYASDYFQEKHDLQGTLEKHRATIATAEVKP